jgi:hypothetical protein
MDETEGGATTEVLDFERELLSLAASHRSGLRLEGERELLGSRGYGLR